MNSFLENRLESERLFFRPYNENHLDALFHLKSDQKVMAFYPKLYSRNENIETINKAKSACDRDGYWFGATFLKTGEFVGSTGIAEVGFDAGFLPATEIGWMLKTEFWHQGLATEAANCWLRFAFEELGKKEIVAFAVYNNLASLKVMERIGMKADPS